MPQTSPDFIRVKRQYKSLGKRVPTTETAMPQTQSTEHRPVG